MAENQEPTESTAANQENEQQSTGPNFALQRLYLKDVSFESPGSPEAFQGQQWAPKITFDIKNRNRKIQDNVYEVVLTLTVEAKQEEAVAFLVEVQQGAVFAAQGFEDEQLEQVLGAVCPNIMYPYAREAIDSLVVKGSFPPLMLAPVNFDSLYAQRKQQEAAAEGGNGAANTVAEATGDDN